MSRMLSDPAQAVLARSLEADRRRAARYRVTIGVELRTTDGIPLSAALSNISTSGFRSRSPMTLKIGSVVVLKVEGFGMRRARVAWQVGEDIGCRFARPLTVAMLKAIIG